MSYFLFKRILTLIATLVATSVIVFSVLEVLPGNAAQVLMGPDADPAAVETVRALWRAAGMQVELMDAHHHDIVLALTSHLPHVIAYTIVGTATASSLLPFGAQKSPTTTSAVTVGSDSHSMPACLPMSRKSDCASRGRHWSRCSSTW